MIVVKINGGLGNQMFQYAFGKCLAIKHNTVLMLDLSWFKNCKERKFELDNLNIQYEKCNSAENKRLKGFKRIFFRIFKNPEKSCLHVTEKYFHFDSAMLNLPDNVYIDGYWQSEKYFKEIENIIRQDFSFKLPAEGKNKELLEQILSTNSVSLHIRRGDYITDPSVNDVHGSCSLEYYDKAVKYIIEKIDDPHFFIFSDEPEWAKENLSIPYPMIIIDNNDKNSGHEDIRLMSNCKHNIIANSSFSWWGTWLNNNPDKIVLAPEKWFLSQSYDTKDLIPEGWIKL